MKKSRAQRRQEARTKPGAPIPVAATRVAAHSMTESLRVLVRSFSGREAMGARLPEDLSADIHNIYMEIPTINTMARDAALDPDLGDVYKEIIRAILGAIDGIITSVIFNLAVALQVAHDDEGMRWTPAMCAMALVAALLKIVRDHSRPPLPRVPASLAGAARTSYTSNFRAAGLCITEDPIGLYTPMQISTAIRVLAARAHTIRQHLTLRDIRSYVSALLLRAFVLVGAPTEDPEGGEPSVLDGRDVRLLTIPLIKWLALLHFYSSHEERDPAATLATGEKSLREMGEAVCAVLVDRSRQVSALSKVKATIGTSFSRSAIKIGDVEMFYKKSQVGKPQALTVLMAARNPAAQSAWSEMSRTADIDKLVADDSFGTPRSYDKYSYYDMLFAVVAKSYMFEFTFAEMGDKFLHQFCAYGHDVVTNLSALRAERDPVLVEIMGGFHVIFRGVRYDARNFEEAVATWCLVVEKEFGGVINSKSYTKQFDLILGRVELKARTGIPWKDKRVVHFK